MPKRILKIAIVCGTRPEVIKLAPLILKLKSHSDFNTKIIYTGQHQDLAERMFKLFNFEPDTRLELVRSSSSINEIVGNVVLLLDDEFKKISPDLVLVQGDTSSALAGALSAFNLNIRVAHLEAGLRTEDYTSPFPEEMNRVLISKIASLHFAPTKKSFDKLVSEKTKGNLFLTGNTAVDALLMIKKQLDEGALSIEQEVTNYLNTDKKFILATFHRRENHGEPLAQFTDFILKLVRTTDFELVLPVHLNPAVYNPLHEAFAAEKKITLLPPLSYQALVALMQKCQAVISDSGGIQEEAPSLGKYVFVTRALTERTELLDAGLGELLDLSDAARCVKQVEEVLKLSVTKSEQNPFGDGTAAERVIAALRKSF